MISTKARLIIRIGIVNPYSYQWTFLSGLAYRRLGRIQTRRDQYHCLSISGPGETGDPESNSRLDLRREAVQSRARYGAKQQQGKIDLA